MIVWLQSRWKTTVSVEWFFEGRPQLLIFHMFQSSLQCMNILFKIDQKNDKTLLIVLPSLKIRLRFLNFGWSIKYDQAKQDIEIIKLFPDP